MPLKLDIKVKFQLTRPARSKGGDRYEGNLVGKERPMVIYIPQEISRAIKGQVIAKQIEITFNPK